jgi:hypothetical protein
MPRQPVIRKGATRKIIPTNSLTQNHPKGKKPIGSLHKEFITNAKMKGINIESINAYKHMGLNRNAALLIETDRLLKMEASKATDKHTPKRSVELLRKLAEDNIKRLYGK